MNPDQAKQQLKLWSVEAAMRMQPVAGGISMPIEAVLADAEKLFTFLNIAENVSAELNTPAPVTDTPTQSTEAA